MVIITKIIEMFKKESEVSAHELLGMEALASRNEERMAKIKKDMGNKWLHHPDNRKKRLDEPRPV